MLTKVDVEKLARDYLIQNDYPIVGSGNVKFPGDRSDPEAIEHFKKLNIATVSFRTKYLDNPDPGYPLDPGVYITYVNLTTGEVEVPPHM